MPTGQQPANSRCSSPLENQYRTSPRIHCGFHRHFANFVAKLCTRLLFCFSCLVARSPYLSLFLCAQYVRRQRSFVLLLKFLFSSKKVMFGHRHMFPLLTFVTLISNFPPSLAPWLLMSRCQNCAFQLLPQISCYCRSLPSHSR